MWIGIGIGIGIGTVQIVLVRSHGYSHWYGHGNSSPPQVPGERLGIEPGPWSFSWTDRVPLGSFIRTERTPGLDRSVAMAIAVTTALAIAHRHKSRENSWELNQAPGRLSGRIEAPRVLYLDGKRPWGVAGFTVLRGRNHKGGFIVLRGHACPYC